MRFAALGSGAAFAAGWCVLTACIGEDPDVGESADAAPETSATTEGGAPSDAIAAEDVTDADAGSLPDAAPAAECVQPAAASTVLAHSDYGFRNAQGGCGWSYRFAAPATIQLSSEMPVFLAADGGGAWLAETGKIAQLTRTGGHPSDSAVVIRRWMSTYGGDIRIRGTITAPESGDASDRDGVTFAIVRNGMAIESVNVRGAPAPVDRSLVVAVGDAIDLVLTSRNTPTFDSTIYAVEILRD